MDIGDTFLAENRAAWRRWLSAHHDDEREIWLVFPLKAAGKASVTYNEAVEEALCFGWIDSIVKKLDAEHRAQRFTPRRPGSPVSDMNRERMRRLIASKQMTAAGHTSVPDDLDAPFVLADDIERALRVDDETWRNFEAFSLSYKRIRIGWIEGARNRPEVFDQRLGYFLKTTRQNKRFGMVQ